MDNMEIDISDCGTSTKKLYEELEKAGVEGLYPKAFETESGTVFLTIMSEISNGDVKSGHNIFIDVEQWEFSSSGDTSKLAGEFTFNYGFGHLHIGYGRNYPLEECVQRIVRLVKNIQEKKVYAYGIVTPIGSVISGYRDMPTNPEVTFEIDLTLYSINRYYINNIYKEGMPDYPEKEVFYEIIDKLEAVKKKEMLYWSLWNENPHRCELLGSGEDDNKKENK